MDKEIRAQRVFLSSGYHHLGSALCPKEDFGRSQMSSKEVFVFEQGFDYSKNHQHNTSRQGQGLKIYPTLVSNVLTVDYTEGSLFQVINLLGQQVLVGKTTTQLDVSALTQGTYMLKVGTEVAKFMKQ